MRRLSCLVLFTLPLILLSGCAAPSPAPTVTLTSITTDTPTPTPTPTSTATATATLPPTPTPDAEATKQADFFEKLNNQDLKSKDFFANLPVFDGADYDNGKIQQAELLVDNGLPSSTDTQLPETWRISDNGNGYYFMSYDHNNVAEDSVFRFVDGFFIMQKGVKMLRIGLEVGGKGQIIHLNFQNSWWWENPKGMDSLISALQHKDWRVELVVNYGPDLAPSDEPFNVQVTSERFNSGYQLFKDWAKNRKLPPGADKTIIGVEIVK